MNPQYIKSRIDEVLSNIPVARVHHFSQVQPPVQFPTTQVPPQYMKKKSGCYVATCVYGSYDCPEVWVLRRYRDNTLDNNIFGKTFIKTYYALSPPLVRIFGKQKWFVCVCKSILNKIIKKLQTKGIENTPYNDKY